MLNNVRTVKQIVKELNCILTGKQKKRSIFVLIIIIISSGFELIGVTAILPFIQAILTPEQFSKTPYVAEIMNWFSVSTTKGMLLLFGAALVFVYIFKNSFMVFSYYVQYDYSTRIEKELSVRMLKSYMSRPYTYFLDTNSSEILRGCGEDIKGVYYIISYTFTILAEGLSIVLIGMFIIYTDPWTAFGVLALMAAMFLGIIFLFKPAMKRAGKRNMEAGALKNQGIYQAISGIKEIFVTQRKDYFVNAYEEAAEIARKTQRTRDVLSNSPERIIEGSCVSGLILVVCLRLLVGVDTMEFVPKLGAFAIAAFKILPAIGKITNRITSIIYYRPTLANLYKVIQEGDTLGEEKQDHGAEKSDVDKEKLHFEKSLTINHVIWKYKNQNKPVLQDVALTIQKGQSVALIGASGSGKTTLADIILGLLHPAKGIVEMDGIDISTIPESWARIVGYVPQSVFLTDDTIRNNIAFGIERSMISDERIWHVLEEAQLKEFVEKLPGGLDTIVGERGIKFSGGQRQRIAIARALYNKPEILVLDEATAALDNETETAVMESIDALQGQITMIIVAHRLTTIRNCDQVYEIKDGRAIIRDKKEVLETRSS